VPFPNPNFSTIPPRHQNPHSLAPSAALTPRTAQNAVIEIIDRKRYIVPPTLSKQEYKALNLSEAEKKANYERLAEQMAQLAGDMKPLRGQKDYCENEQLNYLTAVSGAIMEANNVDVLMDKTSYRAGNDMRVDSRRGKVFFGPHQSLVWDRCGNGCSKVLWVGSNENKGWWQMTAEERKMHAVLVRADLPIDPKIPKDTKVIRVVPAQWGDKVWPTNNWGTMVYLACMDRVRCKRGMIPKAYILDDDRVECARAVESFQARINQQL